MKKYAIVLVLAVVLVLVAGSCNRETCPAYSKADSQLPKILVEASAAHSYFHLFKNLSHE
jgi:hypothetical protein